MILERVLWSYVFIKWQVFLFYAFSLKWDKCNNMIWIFFINLSCLFWVHKPEETFLLSASKGLNFFQVNLNCRFHWEGTVAFYKVTKFQYQKDKCLCFILLIHYWWYPRCLSVACKVLFLWILKENCWSEGLWAIFKYKNIFDMHKVFF